MKQDNKSLVLLLLIIFGVAGSLLLLGMTFCQAYILATYQGLPPVWQQILFFELLLLAGGFAVRKLAYAEDQV